MKKVLAVSSILLGVVFLAGCGRRQTSQTQPTTLAPVTQWPANNQPVASQPAPATSALATYTNVKWGFEVGYPTGYEVKTDTEKTTELDLSIRKIGDLEEFKNSDGVCANCAFRLQVLPKFIGGSKDGVFKTPEDWVKFQKGIGASYSQITLAGKTAYTMAEQGTGRKIYLVFTANGVMYDRYDISVKGNDSDADTILPTFKFTK